MAAKLKADKWLMRKEISKLLRTLPQTDINMQCETPADSSGGHNLLTHGILATSGTSHCTPAEDLIFSAEQKRQLLSEHAHRRAQHVLVGVRNHPCRFVVA